MDKGETPVKNCPFRWRYIILPLFIFLLSVILTAVFLNKLPAEVAYIFQGDGSPARLLGKGGVVLWILGLQLGLVLIAGAVTLGMASVYNRYVQEENTEVKPEKIIALMGNMVILPQIIIFFTMLDIFSYNSYKIHIMPLWLNALIVLVIGGIVLGIFFIRALLQAWRTGKE